MGLSNPSDHRQASSQAKLPSFELDEAQEDEVTTVRAKQPSRELEPGKSLTNRPKLALPLGIRELTRRAFALASAGLRKTQSWLAQTLRAMERSGHWTSRWAAATVTAFSLAAIVYPYFRVAYEQNSKRLDVSSNSRIATANVARPEEQPTAAPEEEAPIRVESLPLLSSGSTKGHRTSNSLATTAPSSRSAHTASSPRRPFDVSAAQLALNLAVSNARQCTQNQMAGTVIVSFDTSGNVNDVIFGTLAGDGIRPRCVVRAFRNVRLAPFSGHPVRVRKTFAVSR